MKSKDQKQIEAIERELRGYYVDSKRELYRYQYDVRAGYCTYSVIEHRRLFLVALKARKKFYTYVGDNCRASELLLNWKLQ